jgi:hypothetical protein
MTWSATITAVVMNTMGPTASSVERSTTMPVMAGTMAPPSAAAATW